MKTSFNVDFSFGKRLYLWYKMAFEQNNNNQDIDTKKKNQPEWWHQSEIALNIDIDGGWPWLRNFFDEAEN